MRSRCLRLLDSLSDRFARVKVCPYSGKTDYGKVRELVKDCSCALFGGMFFSLRGL